MPTPHSEESSQSSSRIILGLRAVREAIIAHGSQLRCVWVESRTHEAKQPEAIALYRKNGYSQIPNYGQYIGMDNSICFEKVIEKNESDQN